MKITKSQEQVKRTLRMPRSLSDEIQTAADDREVSVNAEIVDRLKSSSTAAELTRLSNEIAEMKAMIRQLLASVG